MNNDRFKGLPWVEDLSKTIISVFGLGGLGSYMSFYLTRAGASVKGFDFDLIEDHNLSGQLFKKEHVGLKKGTALLNIINEYTDDRLKFKYYDTKIDDVTAKEYVNNYSVVCFDNIKARKHVYQAWKEAYKDNPYKFFVDIRLAVDFYEIFFITAPSEEYEKHLYDDSEVRPTPCTMKQTTHIASMSTAHAMNIITNYFTNLAFRDNIQTLPFHTTFNGPNNLMTNEE